ncbi:MAG: VIT domain-containing protein [Planctomycetota bacterium]|nr:VIT domain-containing protein [Planctomycetota bacterium]
MSETPETNPSLPNAADENVRRLLSEVYRPEIPDSAFIKRVEEQMYAVASAPVSYRLWTSPRFAAAASAAVAAMLLIGVGWLLFHGGAATYEKVPNLLQANNMQPGGDGTNAIVSGFAGLTPRPRAQSPAAKTVAIGDSFQTKAAERRRIVLPDGSVLYVNQNTTAKLEADRRLSVSAGEVYVEVSPRSAGSASGTATFVVKTPSRTVSAMGTKFDVQVGSEGTGVLVTQGQVQVSDLKSALTSGQQLAPEKAKTESPIAPAPRASKALDWTQDLMAAAESPLVPDSEYQGGAIIVVDPYGQQARLSLRKYHIDVHIEDGFARTTIDQTYFNHENSRQEGTFYFPLPADASLNRLAMYVDGKLMEGGMAERDYARAVYEQILYTRRDPALLEWMDGSTFKMRVFPLEPRQEKRIIISYVQKLPEAYSQTEYRFPAGHNMELVRDWSFHATVKNAFGTHWSSDSHVLRANYVGNDLTLDAADKLIKPDQDVVVRLQNSQRAQSLADVSRFSGANHEGSRYLMLRYRPNLPSDAVRQRRDWVFLFESSGNRDPLLARVQVDVIKTILENVEHDDTFNIVTAGTRTTTYATSAQPATPQNVKAAVAYLEKSHLVGALDLAKALSAVEPLVQGAQNPYLVHVGAGVSALGERREDVLAQRVPPRAHYVGVGVGKQWSRAFMKAAAARTGGYFTQINPDEQITWRAFDLVATLNTPRLLDIKVADSAGQTAFLGFSDSISQGEELAAVARIDAGSPDPKELTITGTLNGQPYKRTVAVENLAANADYLPRAWAKMEIDRLLADNAETNKPRIIELSKAMYVMSPFTSLLVLEDEKMYEQFKVDRGRKDHWAMYAAPEKINVVNEPDGNSPTGAAKTGENAAQKPSAEQILQTILVRFPPRLLYWPNEQYNYGSQTMTAEQIYTIYSGAHLVNMNFQRGEERGMLMSYGGRRGFFGGSAGGGGFGGGGESERWDGDQRLNLWAMRGGEININAASREISDMLSTASPTIAVDKKSAGKSRAGGDVDRATFFRSVASSSRLIGSRQERFSTALDARIVVSGKPISGRFDEALSDELRRRGGPRGANQLADLSQIAGFDFYSLIEAKEKQLGAREVGASGVYKRVRNYSSNNLLYQRPHFSGDWRFFSDLVHFAPGMNTSQADIDAVLEAEAAADPAAAPGNIDPAARKLIEQARSTGWQSVTIRPAGRDREFTITFDDSGRYAYQRKISENLREYVYCDGKTLWHIYPDLGIGSQRTVSRFHRAEFASLVPYFLPSADDLARGLDLTLLDPHTIALTPRRIDQPTPATQPTTQPMYAKLHLIFDDRSQLIERRIIEMPSGKTLYRQTCTGTGVVQLLNADGKEIDKQDLSLKDAQFVNVTPDAKDVVVLPLPLRTREYVMQNRRLKDDGKYEWSSDDALAVIAADLSVNFSDMTEVMAHRFFSNNDRRMGFYTLLVSAGQHLDVKVFRQLVNNVAVSFDPLADHPNSSLAQYIVEQLRFTQQGYTADTPAPDSSKTSFINRLANVRYIQARFMSGRANQGEENSRRADRQRALDFIRTCNDPYLGWSVLSLIHNYGGGYAGFYDQLADAAKAFQEVDGLGYSARYEYASALQNGGKYAEARKLFGELYRQTVDKGILPPIDYQFRNAFQQDDAGRGEFIKMLRDASATLIAKAGRPAGVYIAWQCYQVGDQPMAEDLFGSAMMDVPQSERLMTNLAAIEYLWQTNQAPRADALIEPLLADAEYSKYPELWRLGSAIASARGMMARSLSRLERAIDMDYQNLPPIVNVQTVRSDYGQLLQQYQQLADAITTLEKDPPKELLAKVIRYADRWRVLDPDDTAACQAAARILQRFDAREMAWDYLTTPLAKRPNEAAGWQNLASSLRQQGDWQLADRAYATAFDVEPTNAQILWDRAQLLQQSQRYEDARRLYRQIADGQWQPRFNWIQSQARNFTRGN